MENHPVCGNCNGGGWGMLRWKSRSMPLLTGLVLVAAAALNAAGGFFNWGW